MTEKFEKKISLHDGRIDEYGDIDKGYVAELAKEYFNVLKNEKIEVSETFTNNQRLMMYPLTEQQKSILAFILTYYKENKKNWPTQAKIRDFLTNQLAKKVKDVECKRKIDKLAELNYLQTIGEARGKQIALFDEFLKKA